MWIGCNQRAPDLRETEINTAKKWTAPTSERHRIWCSSHFGGAGLFGYLWADSNQEKQLRKKKRKRRVLKLRDKELCSSNQCFWFNQLWGRSHWGSAVPHSQPDAPRLLRSYRRAAGVIVLLGWITRAFLFWEALVTTSRWEHATKWKRKGATAASTDGCTGAGLPGRGAQAAAAAAGAGAAAAASAAGAVGWWQKGREQRAHPLPLASLS